MKSFLNKVSKFLKKISTKPKYRKFLEVFGRAYEDFFCYVLFDIWFNLFYLFLSYLPQNKELVNKNLKKLEKAIESKSINEKNDFLKDYYYYLYDGYKGFPDWKARCKRVFAVRNFKGDCDDYAILVNMLFPSDFGKVYVIVPYDLNLIKRMHLVYVTREKIYSSGEIFDNKSGEYGFEDSLKYFLKKQYDGIDLFYFSN
jgi:hypothetical protein